MLAAPFEHADQHHRDHQDEDDLEIVCGLIYCHLYIRISHEIFQSSPPHQSLNLNRLSAAQNIYLSISLEKLLESKKEHIKKKKI